MDKLKNQNGISRQQAVQPVMPAFETIREFHIPHNTFFHEFDNPDIDRSYIGKKVCYKIVRNNNQERAVNIQLME